LEDNLFTSVAINRGPFAAVADALRYRWTISESLINSIRLMLEDGFSPDEPERTPPVTIGAGRLVDLDRFTDLLDRVLTA
jgi:hypothetical protein